MFYPPKGRLLADSCRGPIGFTYVLFWVSKTLEAFKIPTFRRPKKIPENVLFDGMGWDGLDGISFVFFNFLHTLWVYR